MSVNGYLGTKPGLNSLPVELLAEIHLFSLSPSFPLTSKYIYDASKAFPPSHNAKYLFGLYMPKLHYDNNTACISGQFLSLALRHSICTILVLEAMHRTLERRLLRMDHDRDQLIHESTNVQEVELPRRLFRRLGSSKESLGPDSDPLPILRYLWQRKESMCQWPIPSPNSSNGYPLVRAVNGRSIDLIRFLLDRGADPALRGALAIKVAIQKKDLKLVKMLIEYEEKVVLEDVTRKKKKVADRVTVTPTMLDMAVKADARHIVRYFMEEKGAIPSMKALLVISGHSASKRQ